MGVDLALWCDVVSRHPLKFKFDGIRRPARSVIEAVRSDRYIMDRLWDEACSFYYQQAKDKSEDYLDWCQEYELDPVEDETRQQYVENNTDFLTVEDIVADHDEEHFLEKYPPEGVWSHAYEEAFPLEEVYALCPSCGHEPWREGQTYCGLCGCKVLGEGSLEEMGYEVWPFREVT